MTEALGQYGILGIVVIGLSGYILKIESRHKKERKEWMESHQRQINRANEVADETNKVLRENTNILSGLKTLLENKILRR